MTKSPILLSGDMPEVLSQISSTQHRDECVVSAKLVLAVESEDGLALAVANLRDLTTITKETESARVAVKAPVLALGKRIDAIAAEHVAAVEREKARITLLVNGWQRKQLDIRKAEERRVAGEQLKAQQAEAEAQREIDRQNAEIARLENAEITTRDGLLFRDGKVIQLPQADKVAKKHGFNCAEAMVRDLEKRMEDANAAKLAQELKAEEAAMTAESAQTQLSAPVTKPKGLTTRVLYDFEITNPSKFFAERPTLWIWKEADEVLKFDRQTFKTQLNATETQTRWIPEDGHDSINHTCGVRVFRSVSTSTRS